MSGLATSRDFNHSGSRCILASTAKCATDFSATRMVAALDLMAPGSGLTIPRLEGIPQSHRLWQGEQAAARTAATLVRAGIAPVKDWDNSERNPFEFLKRALNRWTIAHWAREIQDEFRLNLTLSTSLDRYSSFDEEPSTAVDLYLAMEPDSAGYVVLGPTLRLLEAVHPRLPATFAHTFTGALNRWLRVYDWRDARERVDRLRECYEMDPPEAEGDMELPDIERSIPRYMKPRRLSAKTLQRIYPTIKVRSARELVGGVLELERASARVARPVIDEDTSAMLSDCGDPLPALLAVFEKHDAIEGQFDEESQGMLEVTPEPNLIIRIDGEDVESVRRAFHGMAACLEMIACATRLMKMMPGNERPD